jgi:hypothetical protein
MKVGPISVGGGGVEGGGRRFTISRPGGGGKEAKPKVPEIPQVGGGEKGGEKKGITSSQAEVAAVMVGDIGKQPGGSDALLHAAADGEFPPPDPEAVAVHADQIRPLAAALGPELVQKAVAQMEAGDVAVTTPVAESQGPAGPDQAAQAEALAAAEKAAAELRTKAYMEVTQLLSSDIDPNANPDDILNDINNRVAPLQLFQLRQVLQLELLDLDLLVLEIQQQGWLRPHHLLPSEQPLFVLILGLKLQQEDVFGLHVPQQLQDLVEETHHLLLHEEAHLIHLVVFRCLLPLLLLLLLEN